MDIQDATVESWHRAECRWPPFGEESGGELTVITNLPFNVLIDGNWKTFIVPKGFTTDLASDPLARHGRWDYGSIVHDYLYDNKGKVEDIDNIKWNFTREESDTVFHILMAKCDPTNAWRHYYKVKNFVTWGAVRVFGKRAWND